MSAHPNRIPFSERTRRLRVEEFADLGVVRVDEILEQGMTGGFWKVKFRFADGFFVDVGVPEAALNALEDDLMRKYLRETVARGAAIQRKKMKARAESAARRFHSTEQPPDLTEWVVGFRRWRVYFDWADGARGNPIIQPVGRGQGTWDGNKEVHAFCAVGKAHAAPDPDCSCGLYATYVPPTAVRADEVYGAVLARGNIEAHPRDFRAEFMRPLCLSPPLAPIGSGLWSPEIADQTDITTVVAEAMGVPVVPRERLVSYARQHGKEIPESLRPTQPDEELTADLLRAMKTWAVASSEFMESQAKLYEQLGQAIRSLFGMKPKVNSTMRDPVANARAMIRRGVGAPGSSYHYSSRAMDMVVPGVPRSRRRGR